MDDIFASLNQYIERFEHSLPSEIEAREIIDLEKLMNDLYLSSEEKNFSGELQDTILGALSITSAMVDELRTSTGKAKGADFYKDIKKLAKLMKLIKYFATK